MKTNYAEMESKNDEQDIGPIQNELNKSFSLLEELGAKIKQHRRRITPIVNTSMELAEMRGDSPEPPMSEILGKLMNINEQLRDHIQDIQSLTQAVEL